MAVLRSCCGRPCEPTLRPAQGGGHPNPHILMALPGDLSRPICQTSHASLLQAGHRPCGHSSGCSPGRPAGGALELGLRLWALPSTRPPPFSLCCLLVGCKAVQLHENRQNHAFCHWVRFPAERLCGSGVCRPPKEEPWQTAENQGLLTAPAPLGKGPRDPPELEQEGQRVWGPSARHPGCDQIWGHSWSLAG